MKQHRYNNAQRSYNEIKIKHRLETNQMMPSSLLLWIILLWGSTNISRLFCFIRSFRRSITSFKLSVLYTLVYCRIRLTQRWFCAVLFERKPKFCLIDIFPGLNLKSAMQIIFQWALIQLCKLFNVMHTLSLAEFPACVVINCWAFAAIQFNLIALLRPCVLVNMERCWSKGYQLHLRSGTFSVQLIIMATLYFKSPLFSRYEQYLNM